MLKSNVKFKYAKFEFFMLHLNSKIEIEQVELKLKNLLTLEHNHNNIVIVLDEVIESNKLTQFVASILEIAKKLNILVHSILKNNFTNNINNVLTVKVVDFPSSSSGVKPTQQNIYNKTIVYDEPLRGGMKVENDGDIIVTSFVSHNAEVIATGNIQVLGEARGRLIAGSTGDKAARIFVSKFNPELIAIGGIYRTIEDKLPDNILNQPVMVKLDENNRLIISPLGRNTKNL